MDVQHVGIPILSTKSFYNGKIDKHMITLFYFHLVSDYLTTYKIYDVTDFGTIRRNTEPTNFLVSPESGNLIVSKETKLEYDSKIKELDVSPVLPPVAEQSGSKEIYVPKGVTTAYSTIFVRGNHNLIGKLEVECPPVIQDLKSVINHKVIQNHHNLNVNIEKFNKALEAKIAKMNKI